MAIKLQILLRKAWRTPEGLAAVKRIAQSLGITPTASGAVALVVRRALALKLPEC